MTGQIKNKDVTALIPLRGGSKGIPLKNIVEFRGKPLCKWVLDAAVKSTLVNSVYVSTDCPVIHKTVLEMNLPVTVMNRSPDLAADESSTEDVMLDFARQVSFDTLITLQATSPYTTATCIDNALRQFFDEQLDSMLTGVRRKEFFWTTTCKPLNYDFKNRPRRQDYEGIFRENGAFYVTSREILETTNCRLGGKIGVYEMNQLFDGEIDEYSDLEIVSAMMDLYESSVLNQQAK